ncbi:MAG: PLP-dependent aminotransferase family protein [Bacillota bacterium]|nr:PLP-dependent aminotransferase family protein [Bacillota bacterium]
MSTEAQAIGGGRARLARRALAHELPGAALPGGEGAEGGWISLGWGYPDPTTFPARELEEALRAALAEEAGRILQYGGGSGPARVRRAVAEHLVSRGLELDEGELFLTGGSTQGFDAVARLFLDPGDPVWTERPSYYGAIRVFGLHEAHLRGIPADRAGLDVEALEAALREAAPGERPKFLYVVPSFQNPTGALLPPERRKRLVELAERYDFYLVEDDAYAELWFDEPAPPPLKALAPERVFLLGTASKLVAPGLRLGWCIPPRHLRDAYVRVQPGGEGSPLALAALAGYLEAAGAEGGRLFERHVEELRRHYARRRDVLEAALERELGGRLSWERPRGGFFHWVTLPPGVDAAAWLGAARRRGVDLVPGQAFFFDGGGADRARLCFSYVPPEQLEEGARRLRLALDEVEEGGGG